MATTGEQLLEMMRAYQVPCLLAAAADWDLFDALAAEPLEAPALAARLGGDHRAFTILLDALTSLEILEKTGGAYRLSPELVPLLVDTSPSSVAPMMRHQANCLRRWARLPWVVQTGRPADVEDSLLGSEADTASFIGAMDVVSKGVSDALVAEIAPDRVACVLDVGGASGTWTAAWLKARPSARAILFDLPNVIPLARTRLEALGLLERVTLVAGDYRHDALPDGADVAWVSAIIHQNSRSENRALFARIAQAMPPGGTVLVRDIVLEPSRIAPPAGALFAVNMLVGTAGGDAYTLAEIQQDLETAGWDTVQWIHRHEGMHSVVQARRADS